MNKAPTSSNTICIDLTEPWEVSAHLLEALESFDKIVAQIEGVVAGPRAKTVRDLDQAA